MAIKKIILLLVVMAGLSACKRVKPEPPPRTTVDTTLDLPVSTIRLPVHYRVSELQAMVNKKLRDTFVKKRIAINEKGDSLYLEVTRNSAIEIRRRERALFFKIPVKITGKFIAKVAGVKLKNAQPIEADIILHLATDLHLDSKWNLIPESRIEKIEWIHDPTIKIAFFHFDLRKPIEKMLLEKETQIIDKADEAFREHVNTRKVVKKLWMDIQKPILINKKGQQVWLKATGEGLTGRLQETHPDLLSLQFELKARVLTLIEGDSVPSSNASLPDFVRNVSDKDSLEIYVLSRINFDRIETLLNNELGDKKLSAKGYSATIKDIEVYGTDNNGLAIKMKIKGDVNGAVFFTGKPAFDSLNNTLSIHDFDFDIESENALISSAGWVLHSAALDMIAEKLSFEIRPLVQRLPMLITQGIEKGKSGEKIELQIDTLWMEPMKVITTRDDIQILILARGKASLGLKDKVFEKKKKVVAKS